MPKAIRFLLNRAYLISCRSFAGLPGTTGRIKLQGFTNWRVRFTGQYRSEPRNLLARVASREGSAPASHLSMRRMPHWAPVDTREEFSLSICNFRSDRSTKLLYSTWPRPPRIVNPVTSGCLNLLRAPKILSVCLQTLAACGEKK